MTLKNLLGFATDKQKIYLTIEDRHYSGFWYEDHMLKLLQSYAHRPVDITRVDDALVVARVRRY